MFTFNIPGAKSFIALTLGVALLAVPSRGNAASQIPLPAPGTASQIARAVAAAPSIHRLPSAASRSLLQIKRDNIANTSLGSGCTFACEWGKSSKRLVVLFGDSHAYMWSPAVARAVLAGGGRLKLMWTVGCPVAKIHVYGTYSNPNIYNKACDDWRKQSLDQIRALHPSLVLLSERTAKLYSAPNTLFPDSSFRQGLTTTLRDLKAAGINVMMISDNPTYANFLDPTACMQMHPSDIQQCAVPTSQPDPQWRFRGAAERSVAKAVGVDVIDPIKWLCVKSACPPVIDNKAVYLDWSHITATYSAYLSKVIGQAIQGRY